MERFAFSADDTLWHKTLENFFLDLIEILDSYDQLAKLAVVLNHLYGPLDPEHKPLFKAIEKTAVHIKGRHIAAPPAPTRARPFTPACSAMHCPCPAGNSCDREAM